MGQFLTSTKAAFLGLGAVVGAVGVALLELGRETAVAGEEIDRAAQRTGLSTDAFQELKFAAEETGVGVESLELALGRMENAAFQAKHGSMEAAFAFRGLLNMRDLKTATPDQLLQKMADGLIKIKDPTERAHKVMTIFGRGGRELIPLLNKGSEGIREFRDRAHELGVVLDQETIQNAKEFNEQAREFKAQLEGIKNRIGSVVLSAMLKFGNAVRGVLKAFKEWRDVHPELVMQSMKVALLLLTAATLAWATVNAAAIASAIAGWAVAAAAAIAAAAATIAAWLVAAAPIIAVGAAIAILLVWLEDLYQFLTGGESVIGDFVATLKDSFANGIVGFLTDFGAWLLHFLPDTFVQAATDAGKKAWEILVAAWTKIQHLIAHPLEAVFGGTPAPGFGFGTGFGGGAASPAASVAASPAGVVGRQVTVQAPVQVTVNTHPGMSADQIVDAMDRKIADHHARTTREALAGSP